MAIVFPPPRPAAYICRSGALLQFPASRQPERSRKARTPARRRIYALCAGLGLCLALVACQRGTPRQLSRGGVAEVNAGVHLFAFARPR